MDSVTATAARKAGKTIFEWPPAAKQKIGKKAGTGYEAENSEAHAGYVRGQSSL